MCVSLFADEEEEELGLTGLAFHVYDLSDSFSFFGFFQIM